MKRIIAFILVAALFAGCVQQQAKEQETLTTTSMADGTRPTAPAQLECASLWWFDDENPRCGYKKFCGAYVYEGLRTYRSEADCLKVLTATTTTISTTSTTTTSTTRATTTTTSTTLFVPRGNTKIALSLDKDVAHSGEVIKMDVKVNADRMMTDATIHIYGVYANTYRLNKSVNIDLVPGVENNITFTYTAPACNTCSGIRAGTYTIEAEVLYLDKPIARDIKNIEIMQ